MRSISRPGERVFFGKLTPCSGFCAGSPGSRRSYRQWRAWFWPAPLAWSQRRNHRRAGFLESHRQSPQLSQPQCAPPSLALRTCSPRQPPSLVALSALRQTKRASVKRPMCPWHSQRFSSARPITAPRGRFRQGRRSLSSSPAWRATAGLCRAALTVRSSNELAAPLAKMEAARRPLLRSRQGRRCLPQSTIRFAFLSAHSRLQVAGA